MVANFDISFKLIDGGNRIYETDNLEEIQKAADPSTGIKLKQLICYNIKPKSKSSPERESKKNQFLNKN